MFCPIELIMGASKNSDLQKCGDILINIKTIKNKAKLFIFHCGFCSVDCDQLKKFSKHLEKHLHYFDDIKKADNHVTVPFVVFQPEEIKDEELNVELIDKPDSKVTSGRIISDVSDDPLETKEANKSELRNLHKTEDFISKNINNEMIKQVEDCENINSNFIDNSIRNIQETVDTNKESRKNMETPLSIKNFSSDDFSEYSDDTNFDIQNELKSHQKVNRSKDLIPIKKSAFSKRRKKSSEETYGTDSNKAPDNNKPKKRRRVIVETVLPILIQEYKKHKMLWEVDNIAFGVKNKKFEIYGKISEVLKLQANQIMSLEDINYHINYLNELYSKDRELELKCKMEKRAFFPEYDHYAEMSFLSDSQGPFLCGICNELLPKYDPYCQHMAQHNETQPFRCPSCEMMFTNYHKYLIHKKRHLGIFNFHCDVCGKGYLFKNDLEWHVTSHTGDKPYLCPICGTGFRARHGYDNHIRRHEERFRYECHICKRGFNQLHALNNHVKSHLNIRDVICKICGKGFVHTKYLKRHELIHGKEKRYKCNECGKAFFQACGLRAHRKNHHS